MLDRDYFCTCCSRLTASQGLTTDGNATPALGRAGEREALPAFVSDAATTCAIACCLCACLWSAQHRGAICSVCQHSSAKLLALDHTLLTQQHIQVSGIGKYPFLALERADLQFGNVLVGEQVEQTVRLLNQGLLPADFTVIPIQPPSGSPVESCIKISPTRSGSLR